MPLLKISLSHEPDAQERGALLAEGTEIVASGLGKSPDYVLVLLEQAHQSFSGDASTPSAFLELRSVGGLDPETNRELSGTLTGLLENRLGLDPARVFLNFQNVERADWGWKGSTLA